MDVRRMILVNLSSMVYRNLNSLYSCSQQNDKNKVDPREITRYDMKMFIDYRQDRFITKILLVNLCSMIYRNLNSLYSFSHVNKKN